MSRRETRLRKARDDFKLNRTEYYMGIADAVAEGGDCDRDNVGAVLVKDNRVRATGYNGAPAGAPGCLAGFCPRAQSDVAPGSDYDNGPGRCISLHAEDNVLIYADMDDRTGADLYVTRRPCAGCSKRIKGSGVTRVFWRDQLKAIQTCLVEEL